MASCNLWNADLVSVHFAKSDILRKIWQILLIAVRRLNYAFNFQLLQKNDLYKIFYNR